MKAQTQNKSELYILPVILHNLQKLKEKKKFRYIESNKNEKTQKKASDKWIERKWDTISIFRGTL